MARRQRHATPRRPARLQVGAMVDGYRVHRIVCERPGLNTLAEGVKHGGERVTLDATATPLADDWELRHRMARHVQLSGSIDHPHVLRLIRTLDGGQRLHLQALPPTAITLAERLRAGPLAKAEALRILGQVAGALEAARMEGLVHRQLSPHAIFLTGDDSPDAVLTDFGIGTPRGRACELHAAVEDAAYRAPEEIRGEHPDAQSNVYTLACILVECLTGEPPFACERPLLTLHAHLTEPPPKPSERSPELAAEFDSVVATAMAKDLHERHASPEALIRAAGATLGVRVAIPVARAERRKAAVVAARPDAPVSPREPPTARRRPARALRQAGALRVRRAGTAAGRGLAVFWPRRGLVLVGLSLMASAAAGFAMGHSDSSDAPVQPGPAEIGVTPQPARDPAIRPVTGVVDQLNERRTATRRRLRAARSPGQQAAAAQTIAAAYRDARSALRHHPGAGDILVDHLRAVEAAYVRLAAAARQKDPTAWQAARDEALDREGELELLLRTRRWT